jgi:hypothetical protein
LTPQNVAAPWMIFEAGALSKHLDDRVVPILFRLRKTQVTGPLAHFQMAEFEEADIRRTLLMINNQLGDRALDAETFRDMFEVQWPILHREVMSVLEMPEHNQVAAPRSNEDVLAEILELTRTIARLQSQGPKATERSDKEAEENERKVTSATLHLINGFDTMLGNYLDAKQLDADDLRRISESLWSLANTRRNLPAAKQTRTILDSIDDFIYQVEERQDRSHE